MAAIYGGFLLSSMSVAPRFAARKLMKTPLKSGAWIVDEYSYRLLVAAFSEFAEVD